MLLLLFVLTASSCTHAQFLYKRMTYNPRMSVPRSAMETLEHLRVPRYYPQMDTQVDPYQNAAYQLYALPPQWTNDVPAEYPSDYDYEVNPYDTGAAYADYAPQQDTMALEQPDSNLYNDLMMSYLMGAQMPQQQPPVNDMHLPMQRRSEDSNAAVHAPDAEKINATDAPAPTVAVVPQTQTQVQVTAVPTAPEKKGLLSRVVVPPAAPREDPEGGQKEEPLFRPLQSSQRTIWAEGARFRKSHIPFLKQMLTKTPHSDPLADELSSLKHKSA